MWKLLLVIPIIMLIGCRTEDEVVKEFVCGTETVTYESQEYNTVQIGDQCWLKENLNVGEMIPGTTEQSDNGILEKYCYENSPDSCAKYGGLYQWDEMMQYTTQQGSQGICPSGWHLPDYLEWDVLEGSVDSQFGIGDSIWDEYDYRGYDAGTSLKTTSGWYADKNGIDLSGFSGLPGGYRYDYGFFYDVHWWTSSEYDSLHAWGCSIGFYPPVIKYWYDKELGFSVRCLRD